MMSAAGPSSHAEEVEPNMPSKTRCFLARALAKWSVLTDELIDNVLRDSNRCAAHGLLRCLIRQVPWITSLAVSDSGELSVTEHGFFLAKFPRRRCSAANASSARQSPWDIPLRATSRLTKPLEVRKRADPLRQPGRGAATPST